MLIQCKSNANPMQMECESNANPMRIKIQCKSSANPMQMQCNCSWVSMALALGSVWLLLLGFYGFWMHLKPYEKHAFKLVRWSLWLLLLGLYGSCSWVSMAPECIWNKMKSKHSSLFFGLYGSWVSMALACIRNRTKRTHSSMLLGLYGSRSLVSMAPEYNLMQFWAICSHLNNSEYIWSHL